jgi:methylaspartate ammonia-lyase
MKIENVLCAVVRSGFFNWDLVAIKAGAKANGFAFDGKPVTPGFTSICQPGTALSVILRLEDGQVAFGDCLDVILTGFAGRDPLFIAKDQKVVVEKEIRHRLIGRDLGKFRPLAAEIDGIVHNGKVIHTGLRFGITQALLHAVSLAHRTTMAEVIANEYDCVIAKAPIPILASSLHLDDNLMIDRMIMKQAELLPHASIHHVERELGSDGGKLVAYASRLTKRIKEIGAPGYRPGIHFDVYGTFGELFKLDLNDIADYIGKLEKAVAPHDLLIETPVMCKSKKEQIVALRDLKSVIKKKGLKTKIIADDWCNTLQDIKEFVDAGAADIIQIKIPDLGGIHNTIDAVLYARRNDTGVCLGGTGNETDQSARITTHIGLACNPSFLMAKPGFGGDEALMILTNEMVRTLALIEHGNARGK